MCYSTTELLSLWEGGASYARSILLSLLAQQRTSYVAIQHAAYRGIAFSALCISHPSEYAAVHIVISTSQGLVAELGQRPELTSRTDLLTESKRARGEPNPMTCTIRIFAYVLWQEDGF